MTKASLPEIPLTPMFINKVMTIEWQEFFRDIFKRLGEYEALTNLELEQLALQSRGPEMMMEPFPEEEEPMIIPGPKGDKGDKGDTGMPGVDGEDISEPFFGVAVERNQINGDGHLNRILRRSRLTIEDGTDADTIKCTLTSEWNGYADGPEDDIEKGTTTGNYTLSAGGNQLTIENAAMDSINVIVVIAIDFYYNASGTDILVQGLIEGNDITLYFRNSITAAPTDLTSLVDIGDIYLYITYITER